MVDSCCSSLLSPFTTYGHARTGKLRIISDEQCIDLIRLLLPSPEKPSSSSAAAAEEQPKYEYSSREVSPPALLVKQLQSAQSIFLLHHGRSLEEVYTRLGRKKLCAALDRFWSKFIRTWDVLLHGCPSVDIYQGIKLAAGGELGIGVGEEEWGSGERDVLEGFVKSVDGLIEVIVSRFGDDEYASRATLITPHDEPSSFMGSDTPISPTDGVIFSGTGAVHKTSLRNFAVWMEWLHVWGEHAYGVMDNPSSAQRRIQRDVRSQSSRSPSGWSQRDQQARSTPGKSPKVGGGRLTVPSNRSTKSDRMQRGPGSPSAKSVSSDGGKQIATANTAQGDGTSVIGTTTLVKYLTLGYGSSWGKNSTVSSERSASRKDAQQDNQPDTGIADGKIGMPSRLPNSPGGRYLIGLTGCLDHKGDGSHTTDPSKPSLSLEDSDMDEEHHGRILVRTVYVELNRGDGGSGTATPRAQSYETLDLRGYETPGHQDDISLSHEQQLAKLRVVVYKVSSSTNLFRQSTNQFGHQNPPLHLHISF